MPPKFDGMGHFNVRVIQVITDVWRCSWTRAEISDNQGKYSIVGLNVEYR